MLSWERDRKSVASVVTEGFPAAQLWCRFSGKLDLESRVQGGSSEVVSHLMMYYYPAVSDGARGYAGIYIRRAWIVDEMKYQVCS